MSSILSFFDQGHWYPTRLDRLNGNDIASWIEPVQRVLWHIDPTTIITALALMVSFFALLVSWRATRIAERAQAEHGRLKDVRMELCGLHFRGQKGWTVQTSAPVPKLDSPHVTTLAVYGGPDPLRIEQLIIRVIYTRGKVFSTRVLLTLAINDSDLRVIGPDIPVTVEAYHRVIWRLPELLIPLPSGTRIWGGKQGKDDLPQGVYLPRAFEELKFHLTADYGGICFISKTLRYGWMLPFRIVRETRPIRTMTEFLADPGVPAHVKRLFEQWHVAIITQSSTPQPKTSP